MKLLLVLLIVSSFLESSDRKPTMIDSCVSPEEKKLYDLINNYRRSKKLEPVAFSARLTQVAQVHVRDLMENFRIDDSNCNPHSWSRHGKWTPCCYTPDHKQAQCMWDKPKEIAGYPNFGYEIAYYSSTEVSADEGLRGWINSPSHHEVMINQGIWTKVKWKAMGVGLYKNYGVVWFGEADDPSEIKICE